MRFRICRMDEVINHLEKNFGEKMVVFRVCMYHPPVVPE